MLLAIETSCRGGGVALLKGGELVGEAVLASERTYSQRLVPSMEWLLEQADAAAGDIGVVGVGLGPGSFTGVRIGVATAQGLAVATGAETVGVASLDALAAALLPALHPIHVVPLVDARKGQVYTALYRLEGMGLERLTPYLSLKPRELPGRLAPPHGPVVLLGDGLARYGLGAFEGLPVPVTPAPRHLWYPRPGMVGLLAHALRRRGLARPAGGLRPIYVRPSDAETGGRVRPFQEDGWGPVKVELGEGE